MLYGYDMDVAKSIRSTISRTSENDILLCSASGKGETPVGDILENPSDKFETNESKVLISPSFFGTLKVYYIWYVLRMKDITTNAMNP